MKKMFLVIVFFASFSAEADFKYCSGKIIDLVSRNTSEGVQVRIELTDGSGVSNYAAISSPSSELNDNQKTQISILLAAYMSSEEVNLELRTNGYTFNSCTDFQNGLPIRFVRLRR